MSSIKPVPRIPGDPLGMVPVPSGLSCIGCAFESDAPEECGAKRQCIGRVGGAGVAGAIAYIPLSDAIARSIVRHDWCYG